MAASTFSGKADHAKMTEEYESLKAKVLAAGYEEAGKWEGSSLFS